MSSRTSSLVNKQLEKGKQTAREDASALGRVGRDAVASGTYLYPLQGLLYLASHPSLFESIKGPLIRSGMWSVGIVIGMFIVTYLPQVAILSVISGPLAFIAAIPLVLSEAYFITTFLLKSVLLSGATDKVFDAVLAQKGLTDLVERGRSVKTNKSGGVSLGRAILKPVSSKFSTEGLWRYLITLPLNFIPGVGTAFFLYYNGRNAGPSAHTRYFQLKGMSKEEKNRFVNERFGAYTAMGAVSLALGLVPIAGPLFAFSNAVGAALYAADLEKKERAGAANDKGQAKIAQGGEAGGKDEKQVSFDTRDEL